MISYIFEFLFINLIFLQIINKNSFKKNMLTSLTFLWFVVNLYLLKKQF